MQVIRGWDEGVAQMQLGEHAELEVTSDYGYGEGGFPAWGVCAPLPLCPLPQGDSAMHSHGAWVQLLLQ